MNRPEFIPCLPESAPFTPEQRAYLNGFFAGLFSRGPAPAPGPPDPAAARPMAPLTILFGSQTGNAERLAKRIAKEAGRRGFAPTTYEMAAYPPARLASDQNVLIVTSTYGDGEPPDNARSFWKSLADEAAPRLTATRFSVCALGDSNYPKFCAFGKGLDERLEALGGNRAFPRVDCDVDFDEPFMKWLGGALSSLNGSGDRPVAVESGAVAGPPPAVDGPAHDRRNPYPAPLVANRRLTGETSAKDTRHFEFRIDGSKLTYAVGDAMGVYPCNCPELVAELIQALGCSGEEGVPGTGPGGEVSLREALTRNYDITRIQLPLLKSVAERSGDGFLQTLAAPGVNGELTRYLRGREVIDLLLAHASVKFAPSEFVALLRKLQPRLYSIASSPAAHAGEVHLCVGVVRYESLGRKRKGVCSTYLAERVVERSSVPIFFHSNSHFRPPADGGTPMIMVGPGTGIAPFRGFLHERRVAGARGRNWLFFGDQRMSTDFLYREELEGFLADGHLTRLDTAFSRDQAEKVYVQNRMLENARELFAWIEAGAHFYVCGDAGRMAKDVEAALHGVIQEAGGLNADAAAEYVARLKTGKRYQRDVY